MLDENAIAALRGAQVVAGTDEVGTVEEVYTHSWDDRPALLAVTTDGGTALVPLPDGDVDPDAGRVEVPFSAEQVTGAPEPSGDTLTEVDFEAVYAHYGIADATMREDSGAFREGTGSGADPRGEDAADDASQRHP
jgi:hypothetical protein